MRKIKSIAKVTVIMETEDGTRLLEFIPETMSIDYNLPSMLDVSNGIMGVTTTFTAVGRIVHKAIKSIEKLEKELDKENKELLVEW